MADDRRAWMNLSPWQRFTFHRCVLLFCVSVTQPACTLRLILVLAAALLQGSAACATGASIRVTTWNLKWFPNGSPKEVSASEQAANIRGAADVLRKLDPDILLLQEIKDYDACARLGEAIKPRTYHVAICSAFKEGGASAKQQVAILAKEHAQAAWYESWHALEGVDPPRGFSFAWFKIRNADIGVYSVHLKSNLIMRGDKELEAAKNTSKREVAMTQLVTHLDDVIATTMPNIKTVIVGGDFNTNVDQEMFKGETTFKTLTDIGFRDPTAGLPLSARVTHPRKRRYPDATFDYLFVRNGTTGKPIITKSDASDHYPVTCDITVAETPGGVQNRRPPISAPSTAAPPGNAEWATIITDTTAEIPYGTTRIPRGTRVKVLRRTAQQLEIEHLGVACWVPIANTDLSSNPPGRSSAKRL
jgi:endonuclease/exonuclease/phosphatase family metal-dependent hydrolase